MIKENVELIVGDWSGDGHGKHDSFQFEVIVKDNRGVEQALNEAEKTIEDKFNIDLSVWFEDYEDFYLNKEDTQKLIDLGVNFCKSDIQEDGRFACYGGAEEFFEIWKQLIMKADENIEIHDIYFQPFESRCSGYGLYVD